MPLNIPKLQITGNMGSLAVSAPLGVPMQQVGGVLGMSGLFAHVGVPMQEVTGSMVSYAIEAAVSVPMQSIYGIRPEFSATVGIPMQQVQAAMHQPILAIPMQQVTADVAVPLVVEGTVNIPMQVFPSMLGASIAGRVPVITSAISGMVAYNLAADLPRPFSSVNVLGGIAAAIDGELPGFTSSFAVDRPSDIVAVLPMVESAISAVLGSGATLRGSAPMATGAIQCLTGAEARIAADTPGMRSAFAVAVVGAARLQGGLGRIGSAITATVGAGASIAGTLPAPRAELRVWEHPTIALNGSLPAFTASLYALTVEQGVVRMVNFNIKQAATTDRESATVIHGVAAAGDQVYAAGPDGVYRLTGTTDGGTAIAQRVVFANMDYGSGRYKSVESCILEAQATLPPSVTVRVEGAAYTYPAQGPKRDTIYRAKLGRGIKHKRLQFEVSGSGITELASVEVQMGQSARGF